MSPRQLFSRFTGLRPPWSLKRLIYTGLGLGLAPRAPGTFGTLLGLPLFRLMADLPWPAYLGLTGLVFAAGTWATRQAETELGRHDAPEVVIDEVLGYLVTMFLAPALPGVMMWGFVFFRLFDILKPWPVSWADRRLSGSLGVMLDDVLAGIYAWLALRLVAHFFF
ncbi:MAG: phosphatidylglycerophosphatase A [Candidatus Adiutrix sp.]|jgi:phosphatidylglycerophosphatase A|nr:phosphatidylglycerophosphatase A [Candidatus Adiutrix sp.]